MPEVYTDGQRPEQSADAEAAAQDALADFLASHAETAPDDTVKVFQYTTQEGVTYRSHDPAIIGKVCRHMAMLPEPVRDVMLQQHAVQMPKSEYEAYLRQAEKPAEEQQTHRPQPEGKKPQEKKVIEQKTQQEPEVSSAGVVELPVEERLQAVIETDQRIMAESAEVTAHIDEDIKQAVAAPDEVQLRALLDDYDRIYAAEQARVDYEVQAGDLSAASDEVATHSVAKLADADGPEASLSISGTESDEWHERIESTAGQEVAVVSSGDEIYEEVQSVPEYEAQDAVDEAQPATGQLEAREVVIELSATELAPPEEAIIEDSLPEVAPVSESEEAEEPAIALMSGGPVMFESAFAGEETRELDWQIEALLFADEETDAEPEQDVSSAEQIEPVGKLPVFAKLSQKIQKAGEDIPEKATQLQEDLQKLQQSIEVLAEALLDKDMPAKEQLRLQEELEYQVAALLETLDIPADEKVVKRLVERFVIEKLAEINEQQLELGEKGTREHKYFKDDLLWLGTSYVRTYLVRLLGMRALLSAA